MLEAEAKLTTARLADDLVRLVGKQQVEIRSETAPREYELYATIAVFPSEERDVEAVLGWATENGVRIAPQGGGTKDAFGYTVQGADVILSLKNMAGILDHSAGDLTVTILPGTTMRQLQEELGRAEQFLPLESAWLEQSTVGGAIAANVSGPKRAMYGSARDYLIASRIVYPDGSLIRTGAKVVKNVAGYDMNKLFIGSMGTLGVFTELTFKIRPLPPSAGALFVHASDSKQLRLLQESLLDSQLEPCAAEWMNGSLASHVLGSELAGPMMLVTFEDVERSVHYQLDWLKRECDSHGITVRHQYVGRSQTEAAFARLRELQPNSSELRDDQLIVCVKLLSRMTDISVIYEHIQKSADERGLAADFHGGCYTGISRAMVRADWTQQTEVVQWLVLVESLLGQLGGRSVIEVAPNTLKRQLNVWGSESEDWALMRGIKSKIDPKRILNRGRFVGGI